MGAQGVAITTSDDIYLEINGTRVAGVQSYSTRYTNDVKLIDAFGQVTPIGYSFGSRKHSIDLSKVYLEDTAIADGLNFYEISAFAFNLVIVKNGKRTVYKTCVISDISEDGTLKSNVAEKVTVLALERAEG